MFTWRNCFREVSFLLVLAGSKTSEVKGISAAGATPLARRYTALADAELLFRGPNSPRNYSLPALASGVSPALISYVAATCIGFKPTIGAVGLPIPPIFPHLSFDSKEVGPSDCLSTGHAMSIERVNDLWQQGFLIGSQLRNPLLLAECVPGGTTTAQAVLTGLGIPVDDLISGSALNPPLDLKRMLVEKGLSAANLGCDPSATDLLSAVGDPFQAVATGVLLGAREAGQPVLLGGGSQMLAVLSLALKTLTINQRKDFVSGVAIATTSWLAEESLASQSGSSSFAKLVNVVGDFFEISILGLSSGLRFHQSRYKQLRDYELGYVKEGVGAGALSLLAQLRGFTIEELVNGCDQAMMALLKSVSSLNPIPQ